MGKHFAHKMGELGFRFRRDSGIIHGAATSLSCLYFKSVFYRKTAGGCRAFFARQSNLAQKWVNSRSPQLIDTKEKIDIIITNQF
jgi:hypothetical protein